MSRLRASVNSGLRSRQLYVLHRMLWVGRQLTPRVYERSGRQSARRATTWSLTSPITRPVKGGNENHPFTLLERLIEMASVSACKPLGCVHWPLRLAFPITAQDKNSFSIPSPLPHFDRCAGHDPREIWFRFSQDAPQRAGVKSVLRPRSKPTKVKGRKKKGHEKGQSKKLRVPSYLPTYLPTYLSTYPMRTHARARVKILVCALNTLE